MKEQLVGAPAALAEILPMTNYRRDRYVVPPEQCAVIEANQLLAARSQIPDSFKGVTWETLPTLRGPEGRPSVAGGAAVVARARAAMRGAEKVVLLGPSRVGKSCIAVAALEEQIRTGVAARPRFIAAKSLEETGTEALALSASYLLLDDVGEELYGAEPRTPLCAQRRKPVASWAGEWARHRRAGSRLVVTTWMDQKTMAAHYGGNVAARIYEGAVVIDKLDGFL